MDDTYVWSLTAQNDRTCTTTVLGFVLKIFKEGAYLTFKSIFQSPPFILVRLWHYDRMSSWNQRVLNNEGKASLLEEITIACDRVRTQDWYTSQTHCTTTPSISLLQQSRTNYTIGHTECTSPRPVCRIRCLPLYCTCMLVVPCLFQIYIMLT